MGDFFELKSMLNMLLGAVSAVFFCFTKEPFIKFCHQSFAVYQLNTTLMAVLLVVAQLLYIGCLMGLSMAVVKNVKE